MLTEFGYFIIGGLVLLLALMMFLAYDKKGAALGFGVLGITLIYAGEIFQNTVLVNGYNYLMGTDRTTFALICLFVLVMFILGCVLVLANWLQYGNIWDTKASGGFYSAKARKRMVLAMVLIFTLALPAVSAYYYDDYIQSGEAASIIYDLDADNGASAYYSYKHPLASGRQNSNLEPITDGEYLTASINSGSTIQNGETDFINQTEEYIALFVYDVSIDQDDLVNDGLAHINITIDFTAIGGNITAFNWYLTDYYINGEIATLKVFDKGIFSNVSDTLSINYAFTFDDLVYMRGHPYFYIGVILEPSNAVEDFGTGDIFTYDIKMRNSTNDIAKANYNFQLILLFIICFDAFVYIAATDLIELPSESGENRRVYKRRGGKRRKRR